MKPHDWGFVRVNNYNPNRSNRLIEMCWRCGLVTEVDLDGIFRRNTKNGKQVPEDCDEVILQEVQST